MDRYSKTGIASSHCGCSRRLYYLNSFVQQLFALDVDLKSYSIGFLVDSCGPAQEPAVHFLVRMMPLCRDPNGDSTSSPRASAAAVSSRMKLRTCTDRRRDNPRSCNLRTMYPLFKVIPVLSIDAHTSSRFRHHRQHPFQAVESHCIHFHTLSPSTDLEFIER